ncbi:MAG: glycosyltransferase family 87 protein [Pseudomonadota bacterium]
MPNTTKPTTPSGKLESRTLLVLVVVLALVTLAAVYFIVTILGTVDGRVEASGYPLGRDYINYWTGGRAVIEGNVEWLFLPDDYLMRLRADFGEALPKHNWSYPPHFLPLLAPLGLTPYITGYVLWCLVGVGCFVAALRSLDLSLPLGLIVLAIAPVVLANIFLGQNGMLTGALLLGGLALRDHRPWLAGILLGILTIKPQLGILVPILLLVQQNWRTIIAAVLTTAVLILVSIAAFGWQPWVSFIDITLPYQTDIMTEWSGLFTAMMPTGFMASRDLGAETPSAFLVHAPFAIVGVAAALWAAWVTRHDADRCAAAAVTIVATIVVSPYVFNYDMAALSGAVLMWMSSGRARFGVLRGALAAAALSMPVIGPALALSGLPVAPLVVLAALIVMTADIGVKRWQRIGAAADGTD